MKKELRQDTEERLKKFATQRLGSLSAGLDSNDIIDWLLEIANKHEDWK